MRFKVLLILLVSIVLLTGVGMAYSVGGTEYNYTRGIDGSNSSLILPLNQSTTSDIDGDGNSEMLYGVPDGNSLFYNSGSDAVVGQDGGSEACLFDSLNQRSSCPSAPSGLVSYWSLDEDSGDAVDYISGNNGTLHGGVTQGVSGQVGDAYDFDGEDGYIEVSDDASLDITNEITMNIWVNLDSWNHNDKYISKWSDEEGYEFMLYDDGGTLKLRFANADGGFNSPDATDTTTGVWTMLTVTYDGSTIEFFQDSSSLGTVSESSGIDTSSVDLYIAGIVGNDATFVDGKIDDVRIYDRALTSSEVSELYSQTQSSSDPQLATEEVPNQPPSVSLNYPPDNSSGISTSPTLNITVEDADGDLMNVTLYNETGGQLYNETNVSNGSEITYEWSNRSFGTTYNWYAEATDGETTTTSSTWSFTTEGITINKPTGDPTTIASEETLNFTSGLSDTGDYDIYLDGSLLETVTVEGGGSYQETYTDLDYGDRTFYVEYVDDATANDEANFTLKAYNITGYGYNASVYETTENPYQLNVTYDSALSINASINIFGENYSATETATGVFDVDVTAPLLASQSNSTETFDWTLDRSDGVTNTSDSKTQDHNLAYYTAGFDFQDNTVESEKYNITSQLTDYVDTSTDIDVEIALGNDSTTSSYQTGLELREYQGELTMPVVNDGSKNYTLTSNYTLTYGGNTRQLQDTKTITVWRFELNTTAGEVPNIVVNAYDEQEFSQEITNVTYKVIAELYLNQDVLQRTFTIETNPTDPLELYIHPNNVTYADIYTTNLIIRPTKTGYVKSPYREISLWNQHIDVTETKNYQVYLLNDSTEESKIITVNVEDSNGLPVTDAIVKIQKLDYSSDSETYQTVVSARTDYEGKITQYIEPNTPYKFKVIDQETGELLLETDEYDQVKDEITLTTGPGQVTGYTEYWAGSLNCNYDNTTQDLTCSFVSGTQDTKNYQLRVDKTNQFDHIDPICVETATGQDIELTCDLTGYNESELEWRFYTEVDNTWYLLDGGSITGPSIGILGERGPFISALLITGFAAFGLVIQKPSAVVGMSYLGFAISVSIGFIAMQWSWVFGLGFGTAVVIYWLET